VTQPRQNETPESIDPSGLWRFGFWFCYVLGSLSLLFSWLLSQVPRSRGEDMWPHYVVRFCAAVLMLAAILLARRIWKIGKVTPDEDPVTAMQVVVLLGWGELVIALLGIIVLAASRR
jgi:hypothetical protein